MSLSARNKSLHAHAILWIILPFTLVILGLLIAGVLVLRQVVVSLVIDRNRQSAAMVAANISEILQDHLLILETLATNPRISEENIQISVLALQENAEALQGFNAGVYILNRYGEILGNFNPSELFLNLYEDRRGHFDGLLGISSPGFSGVIEDARSGKRIFALSSPLLKGGEIPGALIGAFILDSPSLNEPLDKLILGDERQIVLVDRNGQPLIQAPASLQKVDMGDRPSIKRVIAGETGGSVWIAPNGERWVEGYSPVQGTGWGVIVGEPWDIAVAPVRNYAMIAMGVGLAAIMITTALIWKGMERIILPIRSLATQAAQLEMETQDLHASESGISEIDALQKAFDQMKDRASEYRAGLRRFVGSITRSQEDERRRIARELHDETIQNLLAISRRLELVHSSRPESNHLAEIQDIVTSTVNGIRRINQDLRPSILEDLGLIPGLQSLVRLAHEGPGAIPHVNFEVSGTPLPLDPDLELVIYRITQEALTNVRKHARATGVRVGLGFTQENVELVISDDGQGFETPADISSFIQAGNFGIMGIQERVWEAGGRLDIQSSPGHGTRLSVSIPLSAPRYS